MYSLVGMIEAPIFASFLPEPAKLGNYIGFVKGISSPAVLLVPLFEKKGIITGCKINLLLGLLFAILFIFVWKLILPPTRWFENGLGIGILFGLFLLTGLDSVRFVLFMVFAQSFNDPAYITATYFGSEMIGLVISVIEFLQYTGQQDHELHNKMSRDFNFGPTTALIIALLLFITTCVAFVMLITLDSIRKRSSLFQGLEQSSFLQSTSQAGHLVSADKTIVKESTWLLTPNLSESVYNSTDSRFDRYFLYFIWAVGFAGVGNVCPPFQSYSSLPYGQRCFSLSSAVLGTAAPLGIVFAHFMPRVRNFPYLALLLTLFLFDCFCIVYLGFQSPNPPFQGYFGACSGILVMWFALGFLGMYLATTVSYNLAEVSESFFQTGAMTSQIVGFIAVFIPMTFISSNLLKNPII